MMYAQMLCFFVILLRHLILYTMDNEEIKSKLEQMVCSVHGEHPIITFSPDSVEPNVECCCHHFKILILDRHSDLLMSDIANLRGIQNL